MRNYRGQVRTLGVIAGVVATALALSACGGDGGGASSSDGSTKGDIIVGATGPASGQYAAIKVLLEGASARFDELNAAGGIDGHMVQFITKDDQYNPAQTPQQVRQLVEDDNATMICGIVGTNPYASVNDYLGSKGILGIPASGSSALLNDHTYEILAPYDSQGERLVNYAIDQLGLDSIAIAYTADDVGQPFYDGALEALEAHGKEFATAVKFEASATDLSAQAAQLKESGADIVLLNHVPTVTSLIENAALKIGYTPKWGQGFSSAQPQSIALAPEAAKDSYYATPFLLPESDDAATFREAMAEYAPSTDIAGVFPIEGYTIADGCVAVLEKAVSIAGGEVPTAAQILEAAQDITIDTAYVQDLTWTATERAGQTLSQILVVEDGKFVTADGFKTPEGK
jgi:ABC-type branched-subunit amino acid transport system substrate-binding protein